MTRLAAEELRWRWLSQLDPPSGDELVAAWRATEEAFVAYGNVYEIARVRARCAEVLRATGDAAGARAMADQARETAQRAAVRSRCWPSSRRWDRPPSPRGRRPTT